MYYTYDKNNSIAVPAPFKRYMTPLFMGDDPVIKESNFSVHITEWEPGCQIDFHAHPDSMEAMYCMGGSGKCSVNGEEHPFVPGSMIVAPPGVTHQIINTGNEMLRVLCVFSPPATGKGLRERALEAVKASEK
jgi:quercetin dioxygenase-like cupin family protein